jgi:hypothetical protein
MNSADDTTPPTVEDARKPIRDIPARFADDSPLPGASALQAFSRFWTRYPIFTGRASRSEFWWWTLLNAVIALALLAIGRAVDVSTGMTSAFWEGDRPRGRPGARRASCTGSGDSRRSSPACHSAPDACTTPITAGGGS